MKTCSRLRLLFVGAFAAMASTAALAQAPAITTQPASASVAAGATATFNVTATGAAPLTYAWFKEARLVAFGGNATLTITSANPGDAGAYRVVVSNATGAATSNSATLTVTGVGGGSGGGGPPAPPAPVGTAPTITTQPASLVLNAGGNATFTVVATGTAPLSYRWHKNGRAINNATGASLALAAVKLEDAALYTVQISNSAGSLKSAPASLTVNATANAITTAPASQTVNAGAEAKLTVSAAGAGAGLTYQWRFNGRTIKGATSATLTLPNVGVTAGGDYGVTVANATGPVGASAAALAIRTDARLVNIATRGHVGDDDEVLISGFVTRGTGTKKVLARAVGPTLGMQFGVAGALAAPKLTLYRGSTIVDSNSSWGGSAALAAAFTQVGAFPLPAASADAAILTSLAAGNYSASVTAPKGQEGVALIEVYDSDTGSPAGEIVNISTRALVGSEVANTLIAGFAIAGTTSDTVLVRGVGPSLGTLFGMRRALGASHIRVFDSKGVEVAANTEWGKGPRGNDRDEDNEDDIDDASDRVGAWRLPRGSTDSALLLTLAPGVYSVHVTGVGNRTGIAMVEVFEVR